MSMQRLCILPTLVLLLATLPLALSAQEQREDVVAQKEAQGLLRGEEDLPKEPRALRFLQREIELGNLGPLPGIFIPATPRYLVTYMKSRTSGIRSATVVSVTNQSSFTCRVAVSYFKGFANNASPVCSTSFSISSNFTVDFCSRNLPAPLTTCNSICNPELTFDEGRAIVSSTCREIGVSSRVYYTSRGSDEEISAITDSKVVAFGQGNNGD